MSSPNMSLRNILILAEGQLGDLLLLTPALRAIKSGIPGALVNVLILQRRGMKKPALQTAEPVLSADPSGTAGVLTTSSAVDHVYEVDRTAIKGLKFLDRLKGETGIVRWLRKQKFDAVVCTFPEDRFAVLAFLSGAGTRVGQRRQYLHRFLNIKPDVTKHDVGVLRYYCELARAIGVQIDSETTEYAVGMESLQWAEECISLQCGNARPPVVIHPGASGEYKIWPIERFAALADRLHDKGIPVLVCGGNGDREVIHRIRTTVRYSVPVVITEGNLQRLAGLFRRSGLVVCNDSGPRHLAIAVGSKTLALFRRHHDVEWNVYEETARCRILNAESACPHCPAATCADRVPENERYGSYCMRMITVDHAVDTVLAMTTS